MNPKPYWQLPQGPERDKAKRLADLRFRVERLVADIGLRSVPHGIKVVQTPGGKIALSGDRSGHIEVLEVDSSKLLRRALDNIRNAEFDFRERKRKQRCSTQ